MNQLESSEVRYRRILGFEEFAPKKEWVCFLPSIFEIGWGIMCFVKRVHGYNPTPKKIVCTKRGWENLFPTAEKFFYDWEDVSDDKKAGIYALQEDKINELKKKILKEFDLKEDQVSWVRGEDASWEEKLSLAHHTFVPKQTKQYDVDVVIAPRLRTLDPHRNIPLEFWQKVVDGLVEKGLRVGVIGAKDTSCQINNTHYRAWEEIDIETDINLLHSTKTVICSESGLSYLNMLCRTEVESGETKDVGTFFVGHYHSFEGAELHRNKKRHFNNNLGYLNDPKLTVSDIVEYIEGREWTK